MAGWYTASMVIASFLILQLDGQIIFDGQDVTTPKMPPIDCQWGSWMSSDCSETCGKVARKVLTRTKVREASNGGENCVGVDNINILCNLAECNQIIHCEWDQWTLGECSETCGNGTRTNTRIKLTEEANGGTCSGQRTETEVCNDQECPGMQWSDNDKGEYILLTRPSTIQFTGTKLSGEQVSLIRTTYAIPSTTKEFYFQIRIINGGVTNAIGIGLTTSSTRNERMPGWDTGTIGYHGDDGKIYHGVVKNAILAEKFTTGDIIGLKIKGQEDSNHWKIQFIKNGRHIGKEWVLENQLVYPTIGFQSSPGASVEGTFDNMDYSLPDASYTCKNDACPWPNYKKNKDWGYYSSTNGDCTTCKKSCTDDPTCNGIECGTDYCSWWKHASCLTDRERTTQDTSYMTCMKSKAVCTADVNRCPDGSFVGRDQTNNCKFLPCPTVRNYSCDYKNCPWSNYIKNGDWGIYSNTNGDCLRCKERCSDDPTCSGIECGGDSCSWWKGSACSTVGERTQHDTGALTCMKTSRQECGEVWNSKDDSRCKLSCPRNGSICLDYSSPHGSLITDCRCNVIVAIEGESCGGFVPGGGPVCTDGLICVGKAQEVDLGGTCRREATNCLPGELPATCLANPCDVETCGGQGFQLDKLTCVPSYCGGCAAVFYDYYGENVVNCTE